MPSSTHDLPVLIIGAGISGLFLAQQLRKAGVPFRIFDRDDALRSRGAGWGLTLQWSLPAIRELLPEELIARLPGAYVDRVAVERGDSSTFPFYDLSTGELKGSSPKATEDQRIRVTRDKLCKLVATGIDIQWGKTFRAIQETQSAVIAEFEDGSTVEGCLLVGCDGSHSKVRQAVSPTIFANTPIPVRLFGFSMQVTAEQARPIRDLDPFFLQGTSSANDTFMYISLLEAPRVDQYETGSFVFQVCISWSKEKTDFAQASIQPLSNKDRVTLVRKLSSSWAEPFRTFVSLITEEVLVKEINLDDFLPVLDPGRSQKVLLLGDALHAMAMYRGEGANHAIVDVLDFKHQILPSLANKDNLTQVGTRNFVTQLAARTRPAVLASRQACLDAHDWKSLSPKSPLLMKREMFLKWDG